MHQLLSLDPSGAASRNPASAALSIPREPFGAASRDPACPIPLLSSHAAPPHSIRSLISLLVRTVEHNTSALKNAAAADGVIQEGEAAKFIQQRSQGKQLAVKAGSLAGADWRMAQDKAIFTAAAIKIQLTARARKARRKVEERKRRAEETAAEAEQAAENEEAWLEAEGAGAPPPGGPATAPVAAAPTPRQTPR